MEARTRRAQGGTFTERSDALATMLYLAFNATFPALRDRVRSHLRRVESIETEDHGKLIKIA